MGGCYNVEVIELATYSRVTNNSFTFWSNTSGTHVVGWLIDTVFIDVGLETVFCNRTFKTPWNTTISEQLS